MKSTRLKISVSQDGLLPQETAEIATLEFPTLPKKLLIALGFERVDTKTYVGVLPVFINLGEKEQEIEIELGVNLPEMRKKIIDIVKTPARLIVAAEDKKKAATKKTEPIKKAAVTTDKTAPAKKSASAQKKPTTKTTSKTKASTAKTKTAKAKASTTKTKTTSKKEATATKTKKAK